MKKLIRNGESIIVVLDNGTILTNDSCTDELYCNLQACNSDTQVVSLLLPDLQKVQLEHEKVNKLLEKVDKSDLLIYSGQSVYWKDISELSMPRNFVEKIVEAEETGNTDAIESYKNFWTLLCLNPDERVRQNLFWFLDNWGMKISKSGLFVGYRNVDVFEKSCKKYYSQELVNFTKDNYEHIRMSKKSTGDFWIVLSDDGYELLSSTQVIMATDKDEKYLHEKYNLRELYNELKAVNFEVDNLGDDTIYTDHHSHTTRIKIGEMVTMPRSECDCDSDVECSRGLHLAGTGWLKECYYGDVGLACLCNPRDVVAIPYNAKYGKLRTCAYLPVARIEYDETGHVIPLNIEDGFESKWVKTVLYDGIMSTENSPAYHITVPEIPELNKSLITAQILNIAQRYIK